MSNLIDLEIWFATAVQIQEELLTLSLMDLPTELKTYEVGVATEAALYAAEISPFWTGALSTSHITEVTEDMTIVYLNPLVTNPVTGDRPADYGVEQHAMGGWRAFYDRTVVEIGPELLDAGGDEFITRLEAIT